MQTGSDQSLRPPPLRGAAELKRWAGSDVHVHCVVTGGALAPDGTRWHKSLNIRAHRP
jgi:hypothetical protein